MLSTTFGSTLAVAASLFAAINGAAAQTCTDPQGLQFGVYEVDLPGNDRNGKSPYFAAFNPTVIKKQMPVARGTTGSVGVDVDDGYSPVPIYSSNEIFAENFIVSHRGYIKAPQSGTYTISLSKADDIIEVWLGATAYTGWNRMNYVIQNANLQMPAAPVSFSFNLRQGTYTPLRIIFGQAQGPAHMSMSLTAPDGTVLLDGSSALSDSIVQFNCNPGSRARHFPPFGDE